MTFSLQTMFTRSTVYPDNLQWFGLTREHAAANLTSFDAKGRLVYRPDITAETSQDGDRKSTRLNSSHITSSYAVFCLKKKKPLTSFSSPPLCGPDIRPALAPDSR